jgi:type II secretory pathway pseudopilin PulG
MSVLDHRLPQRQKGVALLVLLVLLGIMATALIIKVSANAADTTAQDEKSALALGAAREALVAQAVMDQTSPGSLPCPDTNNDGISDPPPPAASCPSYIGRLPWKTLGLPDLRDGYGERLWYVLSPNFVNNYTSFPINSNTQGQLTVTGLTPANNVVAILFSPGPTIGAQQRDATNENNVVNYLEGSNAAGTPPGPPSNSSYAALQPSATFNDRLLVITSDMLFPQVERRVAREARMCLSAFSQQPGANNRFPWATPLSDLTLFADDHTQRQGRIPLTLNDTNASLGTTGLNWVNPGPPLQPCFAPTTWWYNWRELLFYEVSQAYKPHTFPATGCAGNCISVNGVGSVAVVVIVAGRAFASSPDQSTRPSNKTTAANYLEVDPSSGVDNSQMNGTYAKAPERLSPTSNFNDRLECLPETPGTWPC